MVTCPPLPSLLEAFKADLAPETHRASAKCLGHPILGSSLTIPATLSSAQGLLGSLDAWHSVRILYPPLHPPSIKAHRYSRQHNRNVKQADFSSDDNCSTLKPFYQLLAEKTQMIQKSSENPSEAPIPQK